MSTLHPIRVVHHWSCSGGTVISKSLARIPSVMMLSEVHPLAYLRLHKAKAEYLPTDIVQQLSLTHNNLDPALCIAAWQGSIHSLHQAINEQNKHLILRSHSHVDFFCGALAAEEPMVSRCLRPKAELLELVTVRHPLDSWLSMQRMMWHEHFAGSDFSHFCKRAIKMLEACSNMPWVRYEEFSLNPEAVMDVICKTFKLEDQSSYWGEVDANIKLSGDSGRSSETIGIRSRRPIPANEEESIYSLINQDKDSSYLHLCSLLGYDPDPKASHPFLHQTNPIKNYQSPIMTESPNQSDLESKLLRAEQNYFDQAKNLSDDHKKSIKILEDKIKERDKDIAILRIQILQAQEELGYSINQVSTLED